VILLHGLGRSRTSMAGIGKYLEKHGGYRIVNVGYASTRKDLDAHASALASVVSYLEGVEQIHFVAHSLGNIVIRRYLAGQADDAVGSSPDSCLGRIVMLAPPNGGAKMAEVFGQNGLFEVIAGASGKQLASRWGEIERTLAIPTGQFGIIAGSVKGNPVLDGEDDLIVSVEETRLSGARDFLTVPVTHSFIMDDVQVKASTLRFLQHGFFVAENRRQPIAPPQPSRAATIR